MRTSRWLLVALGVALVTTLAPPAGASAPPVAQTYAVVAPDDTGTARVVVACTGRSPANEAALTTVSCDLYDSSGRPSIHHERVFSGPAGACVINAFNMVDPVEYCTTVKTTYLNLATQTSTQCGHAGNGLPPHNAPGPHTPTLLECLDPVGLPV